MATSRVRWTEDESLLLVRLYLEHGVTQGVKGGLLDGLVATFNKELGYGSTHVRRRDSKSIQNRISRLRAGRRTRKKRGEHAYAHLRTREAREFYIQIDTYLDQIERSKSVASSSLSVGPSSLAGPSSMGEPHASSGFLPRPTHASFLGQSTKDLIGGDFSKKKRKRDFDTSSRSSSFINSVPLSAAAVEYSPRPHHNPHQAHQWTQGPNSSGSQNMAWMHHAQLMAQMQYQQAMLASSNPALIAYAAQMASMPSGANHQARQMPQSMQQMLHYQQVAQTLANQTPAPVHPTAQSSSALLTSASPALSSSLSLLEIPSSSRERSLSPQARPQQQHASPPFQPAPVPPVEEERPAKKQKPLTPVASDHRRSPLSSDIKGSRSSSVSPSREEASAADVLLALS